MPSIEVMTYRELLETKEWISRRTEIVVRDGYKCKSCSNAKLISELHCGYADLGMAQQKGTFAFMLGYQLPDYANHLFLYDDYTFANLQGNPLVYFLPGEPFASIKLVREMTGRESTLYQSRERKILDYMVRFLEAEYRSAMAKRNTSYLSDYEMGQISKAAFLSAEYLNGLEAIKEEIKAQPINIINTDLNTVTWTSVKGLNVHHKYYQESKMPWEYPDTALETYCHKCHKELHEHMKIPKLNSAGREVDFMTPCPRCSGTGELTEYYYVQEGICFQCNGARYIELM